MSRSPDSRSTAPRVARHAAALAILLVAPALGAQAPAARADSALAPAGGARAPSAPPDEGSGGSYSSAALRGFVARAARGNQLPPELVAYRAAIETEISVIARRDEGTEGVVGVEQASSVLRWTRTGYYDQHVVGYRAQQSGVNVSLVGMFRGGWATPTLYGNRFRLRAAQRDSGRKLPRAGSRMDDTIAVVHPLADDRDRWYRYTGGDTIVTVRAGGRAVPIVRVQVEPRADLPGRAGLFRGELDLDATRAHVVRMRGHLVAPEERGVAARVRRAFVQGYAYIEYVNAEREGAYWLPSYQRVELHATGALLGEARGIVRIVSRFGDLAVNDTTLPAAELAAADSLRDVRRRRLTFATADSLTRYDRWQRDIGTATAELHGDDFADLAPDLWRTVGEPRVEWIPQRVSDLLRYNRVEGTWTGASARVRLRDVAPGVIARANVGWAWSEQTVRGRASVERWIPGDSGRRTGALAGPGWLLGVRAGRTLDITNDLRNPFDSGSTLAALFGADQYDYVDRRLATLSATRVVGRRAAIARLELGVASDHYVPTTVQSAPFSGDDFRPNRGVDEGRWARTAFTLELNPDVNAEFVRPGWGAQLLYERGDGDRDWQRIDARLVTRQNRPLARGTLTLVVRADGGVLAGPDRLPQQLYELGSTQNLPGYDYKEFVGDQVALGRVMLLWASPWWRGPLRTRRPVPMAFPGLNPGLSVGVQSGWTSLSNDAARAAAERLQPVGAPLLDPVPRETDGVRTSLNAGFRFFGGAVFVGVAKPLDGGGKWRGVISLSQQL